MINVLILGGYGFMGQNLQKVFKNDKQYNIVIGSRRNGVDMTNRQKLLDYLKDTKPDIIINAAADVGSVHYVNSHPADVVEQNSIMLLNLYSAINEINRDIIIINPIANCTYPSEVSKQIENEWWNGRPHDTVESYATTRKLGFIISECYNRQYNIKTINLIMPNAYGPLDHRNPEKTHAMNGLVLRMLEAKETQQSEFVIWGSGKPIREWIYMEDMAKIIKLVIDKKIFDLPNPINVAQNYGVTILDSAKLIREILDYDVMFVNDTSKKDGDPIKIMDDALFRKYFPDFKFTSYIEGIKNTINYYKKIGFL